uniref:RING-type E3 ubiquitin transferase n=1 Tax=Opuntia streptacantha TaxID=393608 RepID=A0A7C9E505_OPUST
MSLPKTMDSSTKNLHENRPIFPLLRIQNNSTQTPQQWHASNSDFSIAIALLAIMAVALLVVSYYIFVIKCCLNWQTLDPLRRFSISRGTHHEPEPSLLEFSPVTNMHRGLDEWLINNIPAFQFKGDDVNNRAKTGERSFRGCSVCLNDFQEREMLRLLPRCNHVFHLDCIDVWLLNNASCPLCRSSISGRTRYPIDQIIAPSSSPQEFSTYLDQDYLVIELGEERERSISRDFSGVLLSTGQSQRKTDQSKRAAGFHKKQKKFQHLSIMGDECINVREKDDQFAIQQPIRRSFSMDSAGDRGLYLQVQEIVRQNRNSSNNLEEGNSSSNNGRVRRSSFFSFGHGRGSRSSSIIPIENDT